MSSKLNQFEFVSRSGHKTKHEYLQVTPRNECADNLGIRSIISKQSQQGVVYSVFDLGGVRHIVATAVPQTGNTLQEQAQEALDAIEAVFRKNTKQGVVVSQTVFMKECEELNECRQFIRDYYRADMPATTYVVQPLCESTSLAIEAFGICQSSGDVEIERHSENLVITHCNGTTWAHCSHITPNPSDTSVYARSLNASQSMLIKTLPAKFGSFVR